MSEYRISNLRSHICTEKLLCIMRHPLRGRLQQQMQSIKQRIAFFYCNLHAACQ